MAGHLCGNSWKGKRYRQVMSQQLALLKVPLVMTNTGHRGDGNISGGVCPQLLILRGHRLVHTLQPDPERAQRWLNIFK